MLLWAALGLVVGWLINLAADAWPQGTALLPARCLHCQTAWSGPQWLGLSAYALGKMRCRQCGERMPLRRPLVELLSILLFAYLFNLFGLSPLLLITSLYTAILLLVCATDFEHRLILNRVMYPSILLAAALSLVTPNFSLPKALVGGLLGFAITGLIYLGGKAFVMLKARQGRLIDEVAFGLGDVKLMIFVGLITGAAGVLQGLIYGIVLGGVVAIGIILYGVAIRSSKLYVPYAYGPYLALAGWIVLIQNSM